MQNRRGPGGPGGGGPGRGPGFRGPVQKPKGSPVKILGRLLSYLGGKNKFMFALVLVCVAVNALVSVYSSLFTKTLIDDYITPMVAQAVPDFAPLLNAIIMMAGIYLVGVTASFLQSRLMINISNGILKQIRDQMFTKMQALPIRYFDSHTHGELMSRYTNDCDTLRQMISQSVLQIVSATVTIIGVFCAMIYVSWILTILVVVMSFMIVFAAKNLGGKSGKYFVEQQKNLGQVNGYIEEMMAGQKVVKVFCHEEISKKEFDQLNDKLCDSATNANKFANILGPVTNNLSHLLYVFTAVVGGLLAVNGIGGMTLGGIASFLQFTRNFTNPLSMVAQQFNAIVMALAGAERIFEVMDEAPEIDDGYVTLVNAKRVNGELTETPEKTGMWAWKHPHSADNTVTYTELTGDVRFVDVDFGYVPDHLVLRDITLYAEPGQKIAFVGSTGAGKTTIINLINRFYDIEDGKIRIDGININKIKKHDLRRALGIVLQDTHLFSGTIADNIRYGRLDATDEDVHNAARLANADQFISLLPKGYDTGLDSDGDQLSQGQRQLLAIARAAVADPPVLILDEATSSIDTRTETLVARGMDGLMKGRTTFVIAHRLSTVRNSDAIMVLEHGEIIERGTHESLIAEHGKYYQLYTGALELS